MRTAWFDDIVQAQAKLAARDVVETLGQITHNPRDNADNRVGIVPPDVVIGRLEPAYRSALRLKADMVLSSKQYVAQFVAPGPFNNGAVIRFEGLDQAPNDNQVEICLFPVIAFPPVPDDDAAVQGDVGNPHIKYQNLSISPAGEGAAGILVVPGLMWA
ncbi:hypothetical protein PG993_002567 [Apiospora rasikravindrae]|uniref:Uncharacterized protein n=1 Tax=Apiospora rasikravindrae TaxID=990691 RepID=A0ABR1TX33_9PEZI